MAAGAFGIFALVVLGERLLHSRRSRRVRALRRDLAESEPGPGPGARAIARRVRRLTREQMRQLDLAAMPMQARAALARALPMVPSAGQLRRCVEGDEACDPWQRVASLYLLSAAPDSDYDRYRLLDAALRSGEPHVSGAAIRILLQLDNRRAAELLVGALLDLAPLRTRLAAALERMSSTWPELLAPIFVHHDPAVRAWGARLAGRAGAARWAGAIRELVLDADGMVRRAAVEALGRLGGPGDRDLLLGRFSDDVAMVRAHAARAVVALGADDVASSLTFLLTDRHWMVRAAARDAVSRIGPAARTALERTLYHPDRFASASAAQALFASGLMAEVAGEVLARPELRARRQLLARYLDAGGQLFRSALLAHFTQADAARLLEAAGPWRDPAERPLA